MGMIEKSVLTSLFAAFIAAGCGQADDVEQVGAALTLDTQINCGGTVAVGSYVADNGFTGGGTINHPDAINLTWVGGGPGATAYQTARVGEFSYTFGGFPASWPIQFRLYFAETFFSATGSRVFDVKVGTTTVLHNFDIIKAVRALKNPTFPTNLTGKDVGIEQTVGGNSDVNGNIKITFTTKNADGTTITNDTNQPLVSAINVAPTKVGP
jgi:hypothetical protein